MPRIDIRALFSPTVLLALGVSPRDMIDILKTIKAAGALHAEFVVR